MKKQPQDIYELLENDNNEIMVLLYDFFKFTAIIPVTIPAAAQSTISSKNVHSKAN